MMGAVNTYETSVSLYETALRCVQEDITSSVICMFSRFLCTLMSLDQYYIKKYIHCCRANHITGTTDNKLAFSLIYFNKDCIVENFNKVV